MLQNTQNVWDYKNADFLSINNQLRNHLDISLEHSLEDFVKANWAMFKEKVCSLTDTY